MFKLLVRPNLIRRFTHTQCNSNIYQNNQIIDQLVEQNRFLKNIDRSLDLITFNTGVLTGITIVIMAFKK